MVTDDMSSYCVRVDVTSGDSPKKTKCSEYPLCQNTAGTKALTDNCACGHNEDSHDELFEFNVCNAGSYCSGDAQLEQTIGDIIYYSSGDLRCAGFPDTVLNLVFSGLSTLDAQNSASSIQSVVLNHLNVPSNTRVIFESTSFSTRRRVDSVSTSYRISPMETEDASQNLLAEIIDEIDEFTAALQAELSSNFQKDVSVDGVSVGDEEVFVKPGAATSSSGGVSITIILIIGVGLLVALLMCFIACKMRENKRLKQEMLKEESTIAYNNSYSESPRTEGGYGAALPEQHHHQGHRGATYAPSSSDENEGVATGIMDIDDMLDDRHMDEEEGEENPNRRTARHASKSSKSMRLVTAGGYGEDPISPVSTGEIEMDTLGRNKEYSGNAGEGNGEKQTRRFHLPNTPPKVASPVDVHSIDDIVLPMHTDQGPEPLTRDRSEGNEVKSDYKNDRVDNSLMASPYSGLAAYESEGITPTTKGGMGGTNI